MKTLLWKGIAYESLEYFKIEKKNENNVVESKIIGSQNGNIYDVNYRLVIDGNWLIRAFEIESEINTIKRKMTGENSEHGWQINIMTNSDFKGFKYIDISLTPFTNTLPVNNLSFDMETPKEIDVIYIDVLKNNIVPVKQRYTKIADNKYFYENLNSGFKGNMSVDEVGLVDNYFGLFEKIAEY
ncbi:putative glycolipid-binding domain-containing protein [Chryseobacterium paludis]|uniref:putative glycolipid-binding domain-containing protein n=1 Tax=Chryseobacterium paludis TaxID=2956784 RepID=UPI0021BF7C00|nr:putative glycolipid-binding domain-containing protein [Chryseobacterium paludis]